MLRSGRSANLCNNLLHKFEVILVRKPEHVLEIANRETLDARIREHYDAIQGVDKRLHHSERSSMSSPILQYMRTTSLLTASTTHALDPEISRLTRPSASM